MSQTQYSDEELKDMVEAIAAINDEVSALNARKKELDAIVRPALDGRGLIVMGNYAVEVKAHAGRRTLDRGLLNEAGMNLDPYYKVGSPFTTMSIKQIGT